MAQADEIQLYKQIQELNSKLREKDEVIKQFESTGQTGWQQTVDELREQKINAEKYSAKLEEQLCDNFRELDSLTKVTTVFAGRPVHRSKFQICPDNTQICPHNSLYETIINLFKHVKLQSGKYCKETINNAKKRYIIIWQKEKQLAEAMPSGST